jgi:hypothetical protein
LLKFVQYLTTLVFAGIFIEIRKVRIGLPPRFFELWRARCRRALMALLRSRHGRITTCDMPGQGNGAGQGVAVVGTINDEGAMVGWYVDANDANHGFIYQSEDDDD